jgi:hypothetical protein
MSCKVRLKLQLYFAYTLFRLFNSQGRKKKLPNNRPSIENACNRKNEERMTHRISIEAASQMKRLKEGSRESSLQQRSHEFYKEK